MTLIREMSLTVETSFCSQASSSSFPEAVEHVQGAGRQAFVRLESSPRFVEADTMRIGVGQ